MSAPLDQTLPQLQIQRRELRVVRQDVVAVQTRRPPASRNASSAPRKAATRCSALALGRHAPQDARQPVQMQDDLDAVGLQAGQRRQRDRVVEIGQPVHPHRHDARIPRTGSSAGPGTGSWVERPGREHHRSVVAGGSDSGHALDGIGEVAAFRARPAFGVIRGATTQQSADGRAKLRHTGEG